MGHTSAATRGNIVEVSSQDNDFLRLLRAPEARYQVRSISYAVLGEHHSETKLLHLPLCIIDCKFDPERMEDADLEPPSGQWEYKR